MPTGYPSLTAKQKEEIITRIKDNGTVESQTQIS